MTSSHKKIFIGIGLFWLLILGGFIGMKEWTLRSGEEVLLTMRPVDPRDIFRGDYVTLSYTIASVPAPEGLKEEEKGTIFVQLQLDDKGVATVKSTSLKRPLTGPFIRGTIVRNQRGTLEVEYGIESYFVPQGRGREIERNLRQMQARVIIDSNGRAVLKGLVLDGEDVII